MNSFEPEPSDRRLRRLSPWLAGIAGLAVGLGACAHAESASPSPAPADPVEEAETVTAHLSGAAFITHDLEASIAFYENFLGFTTRRRATLDTSASLDVFGLAEGAVIDYAALVPAGWPEEAPNHPGLNFAQIKEAAASPFAQDPTRGPQAGELVLAFNVTGLRTIEQAMSEAGVPVVAALAASATGKSETLTVLDPNGARVQLYEYIPTEQTAEEGDG